MIPIRDHNPSARVPIVTYALIAANVLVFLSYGFEGDSRAVAMVFTTWGLQPAELMQGQGSYALLTSMFFHGGWMHLGGNMLFLWIFGDNLEDQMGPGRYLLFYLSGGILAALGQVIAAPYSDVPMVGASGAIAAVLGGYLVLFPAARVDFMVIFIIFFKVFTVPAWLMLGLWFAFQVGNGLIANTDQGGVAYWAHAGGFVAGVLMVLPLWLRLGGPAFWTRHRMQPPHPEARYDTSRIPRVVPRRKTGVSGIPRVRKRR